MGEKFQANYDIVRLYDENNPPPHVIKVGILPFIPAGRPEDWQVLVMRPRTEAKHLGAPLFQLAKGTRRVHVNDNWCDMRQDDLVHADESFWEALLDTALREGREEAGLKPSNIRRIFDLGGFSFTSATKGLKKPLHMFAAEVRDARDFDPYEFSTAETKWMTQAAFVAVGRPDHGEILTAMMARLTRAYGGGEA